MKLNFDMLTKGLLFVGILLMSQTLLAQRDISGQITDAETGEPLIGANILIVGTSTGTITDFDGNYAMTLPEGTTDLEVSYTGYASKRVTVGSESVLNIQLSAGEVLDEVVVIGYGSVKKDDATGSVNAISDEDFNKGVIVSPDQLITGKVAGVQVSKNSGEPGGGTSIRIRGGTSINAGNEPLFVIDGVPIDNNGNPGTRNPLNFINPNDIATFTVLKDASATAIYGSRGANGVIIITTKRGKAGSPSRLTYDGSYTTSNIIDDLPILSTEAFRNLVTFVAPERLERLGSASTNWFDEVTRPATGQNHNLSFTGGAENIGYRVSVGYQGLEGVIKTSKTERTTIGLNYNHSLLDETLNININLKGAFTKDRFDQGLGASWYFDPTQPVYDPSNTAFGGFFEYGVGLAPRNPVSGIEQIDATGRSFRTLGNIEFEYKMDELIQGLSAKLNLGYDANNGRAATFTPTTYRNKLVSDRDGEIYMENFTRTSSLLDAYLNYKRSFGVHDLDITAGYSYQDFDAEFPQFLAYDLSNDIFGTNSTNPASEFEASNFVVQNRLISFFGRINYGINSKYLFTATLRRDGSTRFGPENRWGLFPSAAFAWRILEEDFADGLRGVFSDLKLRVGYGITGNQEIGDFNYLPRYSLSDAQARYLFGNQYITTVRPDAYDAGLKWEETASLNVGLDFGFGNGRFSGILDYYNKRTNDLLFTVNVPAGTNLSDRVLTNIGEVENEGVELTLNAIAVDSRDFKWDLSGNIAYNRNQILAIDQTSDAGILTGGIAGGVGNNVQILRVGQPAYSFFLFEHKLDANGLPLVDGIDHNDDGTINLADIYEDTNGDGMVNDLDKRPIEKPAPDFIFGLTSAMSYKGFDLSFTLRGSLGNYVYNNSSSDGGYLNRVNERGDIFLNNVHESALVTRFNGPQYFSDYYLEDGSFLRLDNITLGYNFNNLGGRTNLRVYATANNLFLLTNYTGLDPEVGGIDNNPYPRSRSLVFGLTLGL
ncbi:SusC/RagA family TonB-linked outer membrane protein [Flavilitoribacter nigricans]|uniref:SusC/RagA family TonB-linked outer membrane protein n=1 Tax=Flavilitoribacter nigricans (strain ATCC 23147 / DSM 23189 / NBRC 102662 / NCIMB 1420 / SS-2) TaxID=1122177 RepID=A0A2D0N6L8_FLAN2|nr:TonB-dependent receptor [Flavilitoribacter nigricans]PHN03423.1 SusC/RagA family TonB-linked outer membrane protein [Flavilitoribacter nigricans DSM 23189 = NBRC 102662]